ncbi:hypothetical protein BC941DRAFT_409917, partial [Chlamydoabsidia padenii]
MSSPYSPAYPSSSPMHSQVVKKPTMDPSLDTTTYTPGILTTPTPSPTPPVKQPVQSSKLPLRKRPAKDQRPTQLQWQPVETANSNSDSFYLKSPNEASSLGSLFTDFVQDPSYDPTLNTTIKPNTNMDLALLVHPSPASIPSKQKQQQQQQASKKKPNNTDENDRPIKKVKRGRPPSSSTSSSIKPLSNQSAH